MRILRQIVLYTALAFGANTATADMAAVESLREGDMKKLTFHSAPQAVSTQPFATWEGGEGYLADYAGKYVVLNFWATWCAPCRKEMPQLSELQTELGGDGFEVVTIATGRNPPQAMQRFFEEIGVDNLPLHMDPKQQIARDMAVLGLPITVILNPEGQEIARMRGDADWSSDSAKAIVAALVAGM
ncbi:MAG: TlpA disulfide reductase family protein [Paracoccaceae bacterium]|uniref:TlpA disulfide reductase family protein n=1 Tax=Seohaeicola saemankumensis TaxID=481181 RepID=UPI001E2A8F06|nr:TlpA disulfide reductase family protein [Seohaeicola saemankumensis]MCD1626179.1 TlpA family protein disulfide reductase [Seohaeicola saemankumensis]